MVAADGKVTAELPRSAFGGGSSERATNLGFPGQYYDAETGLFYNRYRYYDAETGRYVSADPAGDLPDTNLYRYGVNPIAYIDPLGLQHTVTNASFTPGDGSPPFPLGNNGTIQSGFDPGTRNAMMDPNVTGNAGIYAQRQNPCASAHFSERLLLGHDEVAVRAAAGFVLAMCPTQADHVASAVRTRLSIDQAPLAKASFITALGFPDAALSNHDDRPLLEGSLAEPPPVRIAAAVALALTEEAACPQAGLDILMGAFITPGARVADLPWNDGDLGGFAGRALLVCAKARGDVELLRGLLRDSAASPMAGDVKIAVLDAVIPAEGQALELRRLRDLGAPQRAVLEELARGSGFHDLFQPLQVRGLFSLQPDLRRFLGLDPQGPLDREVDGEPLWRVLRRVLDGRLPVDAWYDAVARGSTPAEILDLCMDAAWSSYSLDRRWPWSQRGPLAEHEDVQKLLQCLSDTLVRFCDVDLMTRYVESLRNQPRGRTMCAAMAMRTLRILLEKQGRVIGPELDDVVAWAICESFAPEVRNVLATLPVDRRVALVLPEPFEARRLMVEGQRRLVPRGAWLFADLCPVPAMAKEVVNEVCSWNKGQEAPVELAVSTLRAMGAVAVPAIEAALAAGPPPFVDVLTRVSPKFSVKIARLPVTKSFHTSLVTESRCRCMLADC